MGLQCIHKYNNRVLKSDNIQTKVFKVFFVTNNALV